VGSGPYCPARDVLHPARLARSRLIAFNVSAVGNRRFFPLAVTGHPPMNLSQKLACLLSGVQPRSVTDTRLRTVPDLTLFTPIQLNARVPLPAALEILSSSQSRGFGRLPQVANAYRRLGVAAAVASGGPAPLAPQAGLEEVLTSINERSPRSARHVKERLRPVIDLCCNIRNRAGSRA
jgi:hypothetical protein